MAEQFARTARTTMRRRARRATYDVETVHTVLDEALIASVAAAIDGVAHVQPMIHFRRGDELILHGLATNRLLNAIAGTFLVLVGWAFLPGSRDRNRSAATMIFKDRDDV